MIQNIGLCNLHATYGSAPIPPTHDRGSQPISGMFASPTLIPSKLGILAHGQGILGDHRNMFADFPEDILMDND